MNGKGRVAPKTAVHSPRRNARFQSAMEYLMTYGWAILIIAVVLGALYSLGVFNAVNFAPKVQGGGCHVFRPNGPGTSWNVNLVGACNNALPQYVAQFNGQNSHIDIATTPLPSGSSKSSFFAWMNTNTVAASGQVMLEYGTLSANEVIDYNVHYNQLGFYNGQSSYYSATAAVTTNTWHFVGYTYDGGSTFTIYYDGTSNTVTAPQLNIVFGTARIGASLGSTPQSVWGGSIANVQIYNASLTANQVKYLYNEGIGGVPISPQYLVGWWPLNGDTNDYSGNNNNGAATAITFNGTWTGGYRAP